MASGRVGEVGGPIRRRGRPGGRWRVGRRRVGPQRRISDESSHGVVGIDARGGAGPVGSVRALRGEPSGAGCGRARPHRASRKGRPGCSPPRRASAAEASSSELDITLTGSPVTRAFVATILRRFVAEETGRGPSWAGSRVAPAGGTARAPGLLLLASPLVEGGPVLAPVVRRRRAAPGGGGAPMSPRPPVATAGRPVRALLAPPRQGAGREARRRAPPMTDRARRGRPP